MIDPNDVHVGDTLLCVNGEGWIKFHDGETYEVIELWDGGIDLQTDDGPRPMSFIYKKDFTKVGKDI